MLEFLFSLIFLCTACVWLFEVSGWFAFSELVGACNIILSVEHFPRGQLSCMIIGV